MTLSTQAREYMAKRRELSPDERNFIEGVFYHIYDLSRFHDVPSATDDRAAELEGALIKFIIDSRK